MQEYNYEKEDLSFGDSHECILLEPYNGKNRGDVITVYCGVYNSLISLKKALPMNCFDDIKTSEKLIKNAEYLEDENDRQADEIADLYEQVEILTKKIYEYEEETNLKSKVKKLEKVLNESNKSSAKKVKKVKKAKKVKKIS